MQPSLLVADEPVSALDVSVQAAILNLLADLQEDMGFACLFITHDLSIVEHFCDRVVVMYLGRVVETGTREQIFATPAAPVHAGAAVGRRRARPAGAAHALADRARGRPAEPDRPAVGVRVPDALPDVRTSRCRRPRDEIPELRDVDGDGHLVACHLARRGRDVPRIARPRGDR